MKNIALTVLFLTALPLKAGDPQGFACWTSDTLKGFEQKLAPKIDSKMVANEQLGNYGKHSLMVTHREGPGEAEIHKTVVDIFVVQSGRANLLVGGTLIGGKETGPGEIRGTAISGAERRQLAAGDIVHIPAAMPHQVAVEKGQQITYVIVKVNTD